MRVQNNGLGIQSTAIYMLAHEGKIAPIDHSIFADTQEEPDAVYQHLAWLRTIPEPCPIIHVATKGKLGDHLLKGINSTGGRFASIPAFTAKHHTLRQLGDACNEGIISRQCTKEYKIEVVERVIRRTILGLRPRQHIPKDTRIVQIFGISTDEKGRADRIVRNWKDRPWTTAEFPLIDLGWDRQRCVEYLQKVVPHAVPRSACVFCPFKRSAEWLKTKANPADWARAVEIDRALRVEGNVVNRNMDLSLYLHRACVPLEMVNLEEWDAKEKARAAAAAERSKTKTPPKELDLFSMLDCGDGMCGV